MKRDYDIVTMFEDIWKKAGFTVRTVNAPEGKRKFSRTSVGRSRISAAKRKTTAVARENVKKRVA